MNRGGEKPVRNTMPQTDTDTDKMFKLVSPLFLSGGLKIYWEIFSLLTMQSCNKRNTEVLRRVLS